MSATGSGAGIVAGAATEFAAQPTQPRQAVLSRSGSGAMFRGLLFTKLADLVECLTPTTSAERLFDALASAVGSPNRAAGRSAARPTFYVDAVELEALVRAVGDQRGLAALSEVTAPTASTAQRQPAEVVGRWRNVEAD